MILVLVGALWYLAAVGGSWDCDPRGSSVVRAERCSAAVEAVPPVASSVGVVGSRSAVRFGVDFGAVAGPGAPAAVAE